MNHVSIGAAGREGRGLKSSEKECWSVFVLLAREEIAA